MKCPQCGAEYNQVYRLCVDCGVELVDEHAPDPSPSPPQPREGDINHAPGKLVLGLVAVAVTVLSALLTIRYLYDPALASKLPDGYGPLAVLLLLVAALAWLGIDNKRCPKCRRYRAMKRTDDGDQRVEEDDIACTRYRCRYCGHKVGRPPEGVPFV